MDAADRSRVDLAITAAADVLRPWAGDLRVAHDEAATGPTAQPLGVDPATVVAGLSLLLSVLTFWQTERHHREEMDRLDREAIGRQDVMRADVAALRPAPHEVVDALAAVPADDLAAARAAIADHPVVRADVAALLGRAGVPAADLERTLDALAAPHRGIDAPTAGESTARSTIGDPDEDGTGEVSPLDERVRAELADRPDVREVAMFGGLAFMVDGRMVVSVRRDGSSLLVRVDPDEDARLLTRPGASRATMGIDRSMGAGWITVAGDAIETAAALGSWMQAALAHHATRAAGES